MSTDEPVYEHPRGADGRFVVGAGESLAVPTAAAAAPGDPAGSYSSSVTIVNPTDGKFVYIGQDGTVNSQGRHVLYPGNSLVISGYLGDIWVTSSNGVAPLFFTAV